MGLRLFMLLAFVRVLIVSASRLQLWLRRPHGIKFTKLESLTIFNIVFM